MAPVFSKFSQLPIELRFMVWTDVLYYQSDFYDRGLSVCRCDIGGGHHEAHEVVLSAVPPMMHACRESRKVASTLIKTRSIPSLRGPLYGQAAMPSRPYDPYTDVMAFTHTDTAAAAAWVKHLTPVEQDNMRAILLVYSGVADEDAGTWRGLGQKLDLPALSRILCAIPDTRAAWPRQHVEEINNRSRVYKFSEMNRFTDVAKVAEDLVDDLFTNFFEKEDENGEWIESTFLQRASISVMACCLDFIQLPKL